MRGLGRLQIRASLAKACGKIFAIELGEHLARLHDLIDVDVQLLDDAVRLRLDLDLRDRLDPAGRDDGAAHRSALHDNDLGGVDGRGGAGQGCEAPDAGNGEQDQDGDDQGLTRFLHNHVEFYEPAE